jgi:hypothetical protein
LFEGQAMDRSAYAVRLLGILGRDEPNVPTGFFEEPSALAHRNGLVPADEIGNVGNDFPKDLLWPVLQIILGSGKNIIEAGPTMPKALPVCRCERSLPLTQIRAISSCAYQTNKKNPHPFAQTMGPICNGAALPIIGSKKTSAHCD